MSWQESRGGATVTAGVRRAVHHDEAKSRSDDLSGLRARPRPRWLVPAGIATAAVLLGGGAAAAVMGSGDGPTEADGRTPGVGTSVGSDPTPGAGAATTVPAAVATPTASASPSNPATGADPLYFTTTGQMVVTEASSRTSTYQATYRIDCRPGACTVVNPVTRTTIVLPSTGPNTWSRPADALPTDACNTPRLGDSNFPRGRSTMTLTDTSVRTVSDFAGFTLRGGACYAFSAAWSSVFTGDRKPL